MERIPNGRYTKEFRVEAVKLVTGGGLSVPEAGRRVSVRRVLAEHAIPVYSLAVRKMPKSGNPEDLLDDEGISRAAIVKKVRTLIS